jgi:tetratricopeptide (TPR) repeat protein
MEFLQSIVELAQNNLLNIITILWYIWVAGVVLGMVICTVSSRLNRRTLTRLSQGNEPDRLRPDEDAIQFELDREHLKDALSRREAELQGDIERMKLDFELQAVLEGFRDKIQHKLDNLPATYYDLLNRLQNIYRSLNDFKDLFDPDQLFMARMALKRGETGKATFLLKRAKLQINQRTAEVGGSQLAAARGRRLAAGADFLLGQLAETDFNYFTATQYYQQAADLQPTNLTYLNAAAELSYAFGEFHQTEHLLEQVLKIQEKLLGPENVELAQTLNNLGVLRHTQGRHTEAEAFYRWALEICEAHLSPQDPDAVNLLQNYAAFLQEVGRTPEAEIFKTRAVMS